MAKGPKEAESPKYLQKYRKPDKISAIYNFAYL